MLRKSCGISIVQSSELYKPLETTRLYARPAGLAATIGLNFQQTTLISDHTVWLWAVRCHGNRRLSEFTGPIVHAGAGSLILISCANVKVVCFGPIKREWVELTGYIIIMTLSL